MAKRPSVDAQRACASDICHSLPEATTSRRTGQHTAFEVRGKKFAYFLVDHHGDGRIASCKAALGVQDALVESDPLRFFVPAYLGPKGWVGLDLGVGEVDWDGLRDLLTESYRLIAPMRLAALVGGARTQVSEQTYRHKRVVRR